MILRFILFISLFAAITTLMAAPPRFNHFNAQPVPAPSSTPVPKGDTMARKPVAEGTAEQTTNSSSSSKENEQGPGAQAVSSGSAKAEAEQTSGTTGLDKLKADHAKRKAEHKKRREPLIKWRRKPKKPKQVTYKNEEQLVPTDRHHKREVEQLGIANLHQYSAGFKSYWKVNASKVLCQMTQQIPHYGQVEFRQGVGQPLEFALHVANPPAGIGRARIRTEPPQWQHFSKSRDLGVIELEPGGRALAAPADWSRRLFLELSEGKQPVLSYWDAADGTDDMEVMLSAMNFQNSLDLFNRCVGQLLRYDFKSARRTVVYFHPDSSRLRGKAKRQLDDVLELIGDDKGIKQIDIELYTVDKGLVRYNFRLATRRARAVRDYLIKRGTDEDKLLIKIHTMKYKKLKNIGYKTTDVHVVLRRKVAK